MRPIGWSDRENLAIQVQNTCPSQAIVAVFAPATIIQISCSVIGIQESNFNNIFKLERVKAYDLVLISKLLVRCTNNIIIFYVNFVWRMMYIYYSIFVIKIYN